MEEWYDGDKMIPISDGQPRESMGIGILLGERK